MISVRLFMRPDKIGSVLRIVRSTLLKCLSLKSVHVFAGGKGGDGAIAHGGGELADLLHAAVAGHKYAGHIGAAVLSGAEQIVNSDGTTSFVPNANIFAAALTVGIAVTLCVIAVTKKRTAAQ